MEKNLNLQVYTIGEFLYNNEVYSQRYIYDTAFRWETDLADQYANLIPLLGLPAWEVTTASGHKSAFFRHEERSVYVDVNKKTAYIKITSNDSEEIEALHRSIQLALTVASEPSENDIGVNFWYQTNTGPRAIYRKIAAPVWSEVENNYALKTKQALQKLMTEFKPQTGGQLILWHGKPGTGKTYALRALCQSWKEWCGANYILDPEQLFGFSPGYFANLVIEESEEYDTSGKVEEKNWKLLILEDTGELLTEDAHGQGLARLLNLVDGFIGQGLRVLVLITTNVEFEKLHPAVTREGRCAAEIKFVDLSLEESTKWIGNDKDLKIGRTYSLAELYAIKNNNKAIRLDEVKSEPAFGFKMKEGS